MKIRRSSKVSDRLEAEKNESDNRSKAKKSDVKKIAKPFKNLLFKKPHKIINTKPRFAAYFSVAGMEYAIKNIKSAKKIFESMIEGDFVDIKHEHDNAYDDYALIIFYKGQKIGYVPKEINKELMTFIQRKNEMTFLIHRKVEFEDFYDSYKRPEVIAIVYG
ncbi:MAG: HIRAN domain-containing protein [Pseudobdellovibrio sp.]